jgi:hypothetical protein
MKTAKNKAGASTAVQSGPHAAPEPPLHQRHGLKILLWMCACALVGLGLGRAANLKVPGNREEAKGPETSSMNNGSHHCRHGPWGKLEYVRIFIEPPDTFGPGDPPTATTWFFKGYSREQTEKLFHSAGLTPGQLQAITTAQWTVSTEGVTVLPGNDFILGLSPEARGKIYNLLGTFPENSSHYMPHRYRAERAEDWFHDSGLPPELAERVTRLLYRRGEDWAFSDFWVAAAGMTNETEVNRLWKTLARRSTLLVNLRVDGGSDIKGLVEYWGRGNRAKDIGTLLASLARRPNGGTIDIVHLLPRTVRALLYTYPNPEGSPAELKRDCHWTSLNFFRWTLNDDLTDPQAVEKTFSEDYGPAEGDPMLGDVLCLITADGKVAHSCVYIADDIVFTKNGSDWERPWILDTLDDVISLYSPPDSGPVTVVRRRAKEVGIPPARTYSDAIP